MEATEIITCKNCGTAGAGKFCAACGEKLLVSRITMHSLLHEVFHYFTHLDKGFGYSLKQLATRPGTMQKEYLEGRRGRHQKPFQLFFLCGTLLGLAHYFCSLLYKQIYHSADAAEADFFRHYFILLQALMMPFYTLVTWAVFYSSKKNYAEILVLSLYTLSLSFIVLIPLNVITLIFPDFDTRYLEIPFLIVYQLTTNLKFFTGNRWLIALKTIIVLSICYVSAQVVANLIIKLIE